MSNKYAILELVLQTCYPINMRDYIINIAHEITSKHPLTKVLKVNYKSDWIILLKLSVSTQFKGKNYEIPVIIYLSKAMPYEAPEVYLERQPDTAVNPKNTDIDQKTNRILTKSLLNWNSYYTIGAIVEEIQKSFSNTFPIYKTAQIPVQPVINMNQGHIGTGNMYSNNNPYGSVNNTMMYTGFPNTMTMNQPQQGLQNAIIPGGFNSTQPVRNSNTNSTVYQSLNTNTGNISSTSSTVTTGFFGNTILPQPPQNLWNSMYGQRSSTGMNTNMINNNNPYGYSNTNVNHTNDMNVNPYQQNSYGNVNQIPNQNMNQIPNQTNPYNSNTNSSYMGNYNSNPVPPVIDTKKLDDDIKKILIAEIRSNTETKIKEEIKRNNQQEDKLKNYQNEFKSQIEKYTKFSTRKEEIIKTIEEFKKSSDNEICFIQNYLSKMQDRIMNSSNHEKFVIISNQTLVKIISIEATIEDFMAVVKKAFEKNILTFNETSKVIRNLTRETLKIKFYRDKLLRSLN